MTLTQFICIFPLLILTGSVVIIGWYAITRGRTELNPDGSSYKTGKLFKGWHFFWNKKSSEREEYLQGAAIRQAALKIQKEFKIGLQVDESTGVITCTEALGGYILDRAIWICEITGCRLITSNNDQNQFMLIKSVPTYRFSELVRDPMSECPTCMASVYGTLVYFVVQFFSDGYMFWWAAWKLPAVYVFWPAFCVACAYVNTILAKKL